MTQQYQKLRERLQAARQEAVGRRRANVLVETKDLSALLDRCTALEEALERCISFLESAPLESGTCCCGSPVEGHGFGDGHSPVDELQYHASNLAQDARTTLTGEAR